MPSLLALAASLACAPMFAGAAPATTDTAVPAVTAPMADKLLVSATMKDGSTGVFVVPAKTSGLVMRPYRGVDGNRFADIELTDVVVPASALLGGPKDASDKINAVIDRAIAAISSCNCCSNCLNWCGRTG